MRALTDSPPTERRVQLHAVVIGDDQGQSIVLTVFVLGVLVSIAALAVDAGSWFVTRRDLQGAADAGAMAGARVLTSGPALARSTATDYATERNPRSGASVDSVDIDGDVVRIAVHGSGSSTFLGIFDRSAPTIRARATARVLQVAALAGMLPLGLIDGAYAVGSQYPIKFADNATGNRGAIRPPMEDGCIEAQGASDFGALLRSSAHGGVDACPVPIGSTVDTEPGNMSGQARAAFNARIGGNTQALEDVFTFDEVTGRWVARDPNSPRVGIVPILSGPTWPNGTSTPMEVIGYTIGYIGKTDAAGYPPYTDNGKTAWFTPLSTILPEDLAGGATFGDAYDPSSPSPITYRLID